MKVKVVLVCFLLAGLLLFFQNCAGIRSELGELSQPASTFVPPVSSTPKLVVAFGDSLTRGANPKNPSNTGVRGYVSALQALLPANYRVVNCGIGGQTTADAWPRYQEILRGDYTNCSEDIVDSASTAAFYDFSDIQGTPPDVILLWLGTNNLLKNTPLQRQTYLELKQFVSLAQQKAMKIVMSTVPPYSSGGGFASQQGTVLGYSSDRVEQMNMVIRNVVKEFPATGLVDAHSLLKNNWNAYTWDGIHISSQAYQLLAPLWRDAMFSSQSAMPFSGVVCTAGSGHNLFEGQLACSCASGNTGALYRCHDGTLESIGSLGASCQSYPENHIFMNFHCQ